MTTWPHVEEVESGDLGASDLADIRRLMGTAFGHRFSAEDWAHALGGRHFLLREADGALITHAAVVGRTLEVAGASLATGYVEAVATRPELQGQGHGSAVMTVVNTFLQERYELGALSGDAAFYGRLGWILWRGPTWYRRGARRVRTPEEDGGVLVLPTRSTPPLDFDGDIVADWREGDVW